MPDPAALKAILQNIQQTADRQEQALMEDARTRRQEALDRARAKAQEETDQLVQARLAEIQEESGRQISAADNEARADLFRRREAIRQEVFAKARERIAAFTQTPAYEDFLVASAQRIHQTMQGRCAVLHMREQDRAHAAAVSARLGRSITLHIDDSIQLGGITVTSPDGALMVDDTLDSRLQAQEQWFRESSGLVIE